jgi:hypothetical protein
VTIAAAGIELDISVGTNNYIDKRVEGDKVPEVRPIGIVIALVLAR